MKTDKIVIDIPVTLYESMMEIVEALMMLDPEKDTPAGELLLNIAIAIEKYEDHYFRCEKAL